MSYEIVKSIAITKDKVFLTGADSSLRPLHFNRWECESLSEILREQGREALYAIIGEEVWNGNMHLRQGNKLCKLYLKARDAFPRGLSFSNYDSKTAGTYLGKMVSALEQDPHTDLSPFVDEALALRNDRNYILDAAKRTGHNFLDFANKELQQDKAFALEVLHAGGGAAWFQYPELYKDDKDFALEALKLNGCFFRALSPELRGDRDIILEAFSESPSKRFHEHLPDLISVNAYLKHDASAKKFIVDTDFICALLDRCPAMHMDRVPELLSHRKIVEKWVQVGKFFPYCVTDLPKKYLLDEQIQSLLCSRFEGTDKYQSLMQRFAVAGILLPQESLATRIKSVSARAAEQKQDSTISIEDRSPEL